MHQPEPSGEPARVPAQRPEVCQPGLTKCQARTRLYRGGELVAQGFPVADISDHLAGDESALIWLDLLNPDRDGDQLFAQVPPDMAVQRRSFELRRSLVLLRRVTIPMREVVNTLMHHDLRAAEWTDSLRDLVTSILETNLTIQGNRMNVISKKVTGWAAIIAVPTFITGLYGMNVPLPWLRLGMGIPHRNDHHGRCDDRPLPCLPPPRLALASSLALATHGTKRHPEPRRGR